MVRLSGPLAQRAGARRVLELEDAATVGDLLEVIGRDAALRPDEVRALAVVAHGAIVSHGHPLSDGDELDVLVPVAGG